MYCDKCNIEFTEGLRYCKWCGGPLIERTGAATELLKCPSCAAEVGAAWAFCKNCGQRLDFATPKQQAFCTSCGNPIDQPGLVCSRCGGPTESIADSATAPVIDNVTTVMGPKSEGAIFCPSCGAKMESWSAFCNGCGRSVTKPGIGMLGPDPVLTRLCNACHAENPPDARVCRVCGTTLSGTLRNPRLESGERASGDAKATLVDTPAFIPRLTETGALHSDITMPVPPDSMPTVRVGPEEQPEAAEGFEQPPAAHSTQPQRESRGTALIFSEPMNPVGGETMIGPPPMIVGMDEVNEAATLQMPLVKAEPPVGSTGESCDAASQAEDQTPVPSTPPTVVFRSGRTTSETEPPFAPEETVTVVVPPPQPQVSGAQPGQDQPIGEQRIESIGELPATGPSAGTTFVKETAPAPPIESVQPAIPVPPVVIPPPPGVQAPQAGAAPPFTQQPPPGSGQPGVPAASAQPPAQGTSSTHGSEPPLTPAPSSTGSPAAQGPPPTAGLPLVQTPPGAGFSQPPQHTGQVNQTTQPQPGVTHPQQRPAKYPAPNYSGPGPTPPGQPYQQPVSVQPYPQPGVPGLKPKKKGNAGKVIALLGGFFFVIIVAAGGFAFWRYKHSRSNTQVAGPLASPSAAASVEAQVSPDVTPSESPTPTPSLIPEGMVLVPAGTYTIGREGGDLYSSPVHQATLQAFYIDKTEVTNAQYKKFVDATGHKSPDDWTGGEIPAGNDNYPVVGVSWKDASAYAAWADKRLPTEEEWEAAARGPEALIYPWGNDWRPGAANIGTRGIVDVGSFTDGASPFGVLDMIGNVWEWTADEFKTYSGNPAKLPYTLSSGSVYRVIRGGAFDGNKTNDATYRGFLEENKGYPKTGFRCVKTAGNPQEGNAPGN